MRQDFLYRIHIIPVHLPPLQNRKEDIPLLIDHFLQQYDSENVPTLTPQIYKALQGYDWPGNVRELQNTIHRWVSLKKLEFMGLDLSEQPNEDLQGINLESKGMPLNVMLEELEKKILINSFAENNWHQTKTVE